MTTNEYRIDDLARLAKTTVRNVRAYQDRGLLQPPKRVGRVGFYSQAHLARLRLINDLLNRGYSLSNIAELISAWELGQDVSELLGLEEALGAPWAEHNEEILSIDQLKERFVNAIDDGEIIQALKSAIELGILEINENRVHVFEPHLLNTAILLTNAGVPMEPIITAGKELRVTVNIIAQLFVDLVTKYVMDPLGEPIPSDKVGELTELISKLRPAAKAVLDAEISRALENVIQIELGERVSRVPTQEAKRA
ncbi:MAG: MerR family transcriptional regulator [Acidimicrobiales bacterium]|nr:MerR family transcriptional regulator [Acidimicrobiales bacterium]